MNNVSKNQFADKRIELDRMKQYMKSIPMYVGCPNCGACEVSTIHKDCSLPNCLCCCLFYPFWLWFQACRAKDINCYDVRHNCGRCGEEFSNYKAC